MQYFVNYICYYNLNQNNAEKVMLQIKSCTFLSNIKNYSFLGCNFQTDSFIGGLQHIYYYSEIHVLNHFNNELMLCDIFYDYLMNITFSQYSILLKLSVTLFMIAKLKYYLK